METKIKNILFLAILALMFWVIPVLADDRLEKLIKLADSGDVEAQSVLAIKYSNLGNLKKAAEYFEMGALNGDDNCQRIIADMYYEGHDIPKNNIMAYVYFSIALPSYEKRITERVQNWHNFKKIADFFGKNIEQYTSPHWDIKLLYRERDYCSSLDDSKEAAVNYNDTENIDVNIYAYSKFDASIYKKLENKQIQSLGMPLRFPLPINFKVIEHYTYDDQGYLYYFDNHANIDKIGYYVKLNHSLLEVDDKFLKKIAALPLEEPSKFSTAHTISQIKITMNKILQELTTQQLEKAQELNKELLKKIEENKTKNLLKLRKIN